MAAAALVGVLSVTSWPSLRRTPGGPGRLCNESHIGGMVAERKAPEPVDEPSGRRENGGQALKRKSTKVKETCVVGQRTSLIGQERNAWSNRTSGLRRPEAEEVY